MGEHLARRGRGMAGVEGFEPSANGFGDRCSTRLSYTPAHFGDAQGVVGLVVSLLRRQVDSTVRDGAPQTLEEASLRWGWNSDVF